MSDHSGITSPVSQIPFRHGAPQVVISSSSSPHSSPSSSYASNLSLSIPDLLEPIAIMSSPSAPSPSRAIEEAAELDAFIAQQAASVPSPKSPHDSPGGAQGEAGEDRDSPEGASTPEQEEEGETGFGRPDQEEVTISPEAVAGLVKSFSIPPAFEPRAAGPNDRASRPPPGFVAIYREQLLGGLRLPIPPALAEILSYWGLRITQVHPNSIRIIVGFLIYCQLCSIPYSLSLF